MSNPLAQLISVADARQLIQQYAKPLPVKQWPLQVAAGCCLATDVKSAVQVPAFWQSSMDGYAYAWEAGRSEYELVGEQAAGKAHAEPLQPGQAVRIFTGAALPAGADTVLMQEKAAVNNGMLQVQDELLQRGANVRPPGSELQQGETILPAGTWLTAAAMGVLASAGLPSVPVYPRPSVAIIVTGNELQAPGLPLQYGEVYEANSYALLTALQRLHIQASVQRVPDDPAALATAITQQLAKCDILLVTGGVSVGDYDYTPQALAAAGAITIFHKVKQKPGKPLLFAMRGQQLLFGLPGNPASVLSCFYQYVLPAIGSVMQLPLVLSSVQLPLQHAWQKPAGLTHFLKARVADGAVSMMQGQESYKLRSFAQANALAELPADQTQWQAGDLIQVHLLPTPY